MNSESEHLDLTQLSAQTGVSVRTIRYYIPEGLLPPPEGRGSATRYGESHRNRLRLIRRLQDAHQPLAAIRAQLEALDDPGVTAILADPPVSTPVSGAPTASDYVRQVLGQAVQEPLGMGSAPLPKPKPPPANRSTWERIPILPDLEIHVRRPLARADQRRLDELLEAAKRIFGLDP